MNRRFTYGILLIILLFISCNSSFKKIKYSGIDRTLSLLQQSSESSPNTIEILFYGQSIIGGMKTDILIDSLRNHYPTAIINYKHKPIGGFTIPKLVKTAEHDLYHENPDLIIFHAYGGIKDGLYDSLVKNVRIKMSSDILLLDHHYVWDKPSEKLSAINEAHDNDSKEIKKIADKYGCAVVNVREQWKEFLKKNNIEAKELIGNSSDPDVHPNDSGNALLRNLILSKLKSQPDSIYNIKLDSLRTYYNLEDKETYNFEVSGNFFQLITDKNATGKSKIQVEIDNKRPSEYRDNYYITRPSKGYGSWMPAVLNVSFGQTFPQKENWTLKVFDINRESNTFNFSLIGDVTGFDGTGNSENDFISESRRIQIKSEDLYILQLEDIFKNETPENYKVNFSVKQIVEDTISINDGENEKMIFSGSNNKNHKIYISVISGNLLIKGILVSKPYLNKSVNISKTGQK